MSTIKLLDCTLRDGAYIVESKFGISAMRGIISKLQNARVDIIECGWLKDDSHEIGTSFFHVPSDVDQYMLSRDDSVSYVAMIDWNRYDLNNLPIYDGKSIDAIRVVFPFEHYKEGIAVGKVIKEKGYKVYYQAANTLAYSDEDLKNLAKEINIAKPVSISVVDTFGAMYEDDLDRIVKVLDEYLDDDISLGFHSHNNQQLAFANSMHFVSLLNECGRNGIVDASLSGMGRGAGNATTELMTNYLNSRYKHNYDLDEIMDAIDIYMTGFQEKYEWGYSTSYCIAGMYCCHVNNIAYLQNNHRTSARDMRNIMESLSPDDRIKYDYDLLEEKYIENQNRTIDDRIAVNELRNAFGLTGDFPREVLLIAPGKSSIECCIEIKEYIRNNNPVVIAVNALLPEYEYNYLLITNAGRYDYAKATHQQQFNKTKKILLSNIKNSGDGGEYVVNFSRAIKRGWPHFDNAVICGLRLMDRLHVKNVKLAGFDGFKNQYNESYADESLPTLNVEGKWDELNEEIKEMFRDVKETTGLEIEFLTESIYE